MDIKEALNRKNDSPFRHPWELARIEIVKKFLIKITKQHNPENITIIDIGCGDLFVLETLASFFEFNSLIGVDTGIDSVGIETLNNKYKNTKISIHNDLDKILVNKNGISIVLLLDVVEHIEDDKAFLSNLNNCHFVNDETIFMITVPSFQYLFSKHDEFLLHFRRYSNLQMKNLLRDCNFEIQKSGYLFSILLVPRLISSFKQRLLRTEKLKDYDTSLTTWNSGFFVTNTVKNILLVDFLILSIFQKIKIKIPGLSNYVVCKKSE